MNLKEFVQTALSEITSAVVDSSKSSNRTIYVTDSKDNRCVEFDVAVSVEESSETGGKAGIKVLGFLDGGAEITKNSKKSEVSRICFGVHIDRFDNNENRQNEQDYDNAINGHINRLGGGFSL